MRKKSIAKRVGLLFTKPLQGHTYPLYNGIVKSNNSRLNLDMDGIPSGYYILEISSKEYVSRKPLIINP